MSELIVILVGTIFVNNYVLERFLGLWPAAGETSSIDVAARLSLATACVLPLSSVIAYLVYAYVLVPADLTYLRTLSFIIVIAASVQLAALLTRRFKPSLYPIMSTFSPLIATNCVVLGIALMSIEDAVSLAEALMAGIGAAAAFSLLLVIFAGIRGRLEAADIPRPFRGTAIALMTAGIMSLALLGFVGMVRP